MAPVIRSAGELTGEVSGERAGASAGDRVSLGSTGQRGTWSLDGIWAMATGRRAPGPEYPAWKSAAVPGQWAVQDPELFRYGGSVWYRRAFTVTPDMLGPDGRLRLKFDGVDYKAQVFLNGKKLGSHEGYFDPFSYDITDTVKRGEPNELAVRVHSGVDWGAPISKRQIKGLFAQHDGRPGGLLAGPTVGNTGGIWNHVSLEATGPVRIARTHVRTIVDPDRSQARLVFEYDIDNTGTTERDIEVAATWNWDGPPAVSSTSRPGREEIASGAEEPGKAGTDGSPEGGHEVAQGGGVAEGREESRATQSVHLQPGMNHVCIEAVEASPHLWSTWDHGTPNMYSLQTQVTVDGVQSHEATTPFGIRTVRFDPGRGTVYVNGEAVFQRGVNYAPTQWLSTYPSARYRHDLQGMREANLNAIRVHAHVGAQEMYDAADREGFLVWADFPLIWSHSRWPGFTRECKREYGEMIDGLYNHPSIFMWCAHNEPFVNNRILDGALDRVAMEHDPDRPHRASSGHDEHPYPGWYDLFYGRSMFDINKYHIPVVTEYGAQGIQSSVGEFIPESDLWPMKESTWKFHNFQAVENGTHVGKPEAFESLADYVETSQKYQYDYLRYVTEYFRRHKYEPTGGVYPFWWKDTWPAVGWGVNDFEGRPKLGVEALRESMQPVLLSIEWEKNRFEVGESVDAGLWVVNDLATPLSDHRIEWSITGQDGRVLSQDTCGVDVTADSAKSFASVNFRIPKTATPGERWVLHARLTDGAGTTLSTNDYMFGTEKPQGPQPYRYEPMYPGYPPMPSVDMGVPPPIRTIPENLPAEDARGD